MPRSPRFNRLLTGCVAAAAANVVFLLVRQTYDVRLGPLHLAAHGLFKPLLILNGAFLLAILLRKPAGTAPANGLGAKASLGAIAVASAIAFALSLSANPLSDEWNYRGLSAVYATAGRLAGLFVSPQFAAWYRPLGFISLWLDHFAFGEHVWAYHLQNVLLHIANAVLAFLLASRLGLARMAAQWAAGLYLAAAVTYEPVMWPAARFDLLATMFTLLALIASINFLRGPFLSKGGQSWLWIGLACYALALLSKESGYAFPVLLAIFGFSGWGAGFGGGATATRRRMAPLAAGVVAVTGLMLAVRRAVLGGIGGYADTAGTRSIHLSFTAATLRSILTKVMPMSLLSVNLSYPPPKILLVVIGAFAVLLAASAAAGASSTPRQRILTLYCLAATIPVATITGWLDESAQHVRFLYMPAVFVMMLAAAALSNTRWPVVLPAAFAALNLCCGAYNTWAYKATYRRAGELAGRIAADYAGRPGPVRLEVMGMPAEFNGVLFSRFELQYRLQERLPGVTVHFEDGSEKAAICADRSCYVWQPDRRTLLRFGDP